MFAAYFIVSSIILTCAGFAVAIMNGIKEDDRKSLEKLS